MNNPYTKPAFSRDPAKQARLDKQYGGLHRTCTVCGETKPAAEFSTLRYVQDGLNRRRECPAAALQGKSRLKREEEAVPNTKQSANGWQSPPCRRT